MPVAQALPDRRVLPTAASVVFLVALDSALLTVALPAIMKSFPAFSSNLAGWVISGYSITLAAFLLPAGYIVDLLGRKAVLTAGLVIFCVGAVCCAISTTINQLILSRCLQAVGGACALPASLTVVLTSFHPSERPSAVGKWSAAGGLATALGPPMGAGLMYFVSWQAIFWIHVPITLLVFYGCRRFLHESKGKKSSLWLSLGIGFIAIGVGYLVAAVTAPWAFARTTLRHHGVYVATLVALGGYLAFREQRFRRDFAGWERMWAFITTLCFGAVFGAMLVAFDLVLVYKFGFSAPMAALMLSPIPLLSIPAATTSGRLNRGTSYYKPLALGAGALLSGAALFARMCSAPELHLHFCVGTMVLFAAGIGLCFPSLTIQATRGVSRDSFALGCALSQSLRHVGTALGVALITFVFGRSSISSFAGSALVICGLCLAMMVSLALGALPRLQALYPAKRVRRSATVIEAALHTASPLTVPGTVLETEDKL